MLVVNRFVVPTGDGDDPAAPDGFAARAGAALGALAARPGYVRGSIGRAFDDPTHWSIATEWESVGAYRRALGAYDVKVTATPLLAQSIDEPSAYEVLGRAEPGGEVQTAGSDLASDAAQPGALRSRS